MLVVVAVLLGPQRAIAAARPVFRADKNAHWYLPAIHAVRFEDPETVLRRKLREVCACNDTFGRGTVMILGVFVTDHRLAGWPGSEGSDPTAAFIVQRDSLTANVQYWGPNESGKYRVVGYAGLGAGDSTITRAVGLVARSRFWAPMVIVLRQEAMASRTDEVFERHIGWALDGARFLHEGQLWGDGPKAILFCAIPNYLASPGSRETFSKLAKPGYGRLRDLVPNDAENRSGDCPGTAARPPCFYVCTTAPAPVELEPDELPGIVRRAVTATQGVYRVTLVTRKGVQVTLDGLVAVNPSFLKPGAGPWAAVVGVSSNEGFTIAVRDSVGRRALALSGRQVLDDVGGIRSRLPASIVGMLEVATPDLSLTLERLQSPIARVRVGAAKRFLRQPDPRAVDPLVSALADLDCSVRDTVVLALAAAGPQAAIPVRRALGRFDSLLSVPGTGVLGQVGESGIAVRRVLSPSDSILATSGMSALALLGETGSLDSLFERAAPGVRMATVDALARMGEPGREALRACTAGDSARALWLWAQLALAASGDREAEGHAAACLAGGGRDWPELRDVFRCCRREDLLPLLRAVEHETSIDPIRIIARVHQNLGAPDDGWTWTLEQAFASTASIDTVVNALRLVEPAERIGPIVRAACLRCINDGAGAAMPGLYWGLFNHGTKALAETYLNCGENTLASWAKAWARANGYSVSVGDGQADARWRHH